MKHSLKKPLPGNTEEKTEAEEMPVTEQKETEEIKDKSKKNLPDDDGIDFKEINPEGAIHPLIDEVRLETPGNNVIIEGDVNLLQQPIPERVQVAKKVNITGNVETPDAVSPEPVKTQQQAPPPPPPPPHIQGGQAAAPKPEPGPQSQNSQDNFSTGFNASAPKPKGKKEVDPNYQTADFLHRNVLQAGIHKLGKVVGVSTKKINTLHNTGKLNKNTPVPITLADGTTGFMSMENRVLLHNNEISQQFDQIVTEEWIEQYNPVLAQILQQEGVAMTPKQQYGYGLLTIAATAGFAAYASHKANIELVKEFQRISTPQAPPQAAATATPPPPPQAETDITADKKAESTVDKEALRKDMNKVKNVADKATGKNKGSSAKNKIVSAIITPPAPPSKPEPVIS